MRCGTTIAHLFYEVSSDIYGGIPPTLDDIQNEYEKVKLFANSPFIHNTGIQNNKNLKLIVAASLLKFDDAFLDITKMKPSDKHKNHSHHPFCQKILSVLSETEFSDQTFMKWNK